MDIPAAVRAATTARPHRRTVSRLGGGDPARRFVVRSVPPLTRSNSGREVARHCGASAHPCLPGWVRSHA